MSIELAVRPRTQNSPMSCWWCSMAMILSYHGRNYQVPWDYREMFRPIRGRYVDPSSLPSMQYPSIDEMMEDDPSLTRLSRREESLVSPREWYVRGMPGSRVAFETLERNTDFTHWRHREAFGTWTAEYIESQLRSHGPFACFGKWQRMVDGRTIWVNHVVVVSGVDGEGANARVSMIDPAFGYRQSLRLREFNATMRRVTSRFAFNSSNPICFAQGGRS